MSPRPQSEKDILLRINGMPVYLGQLTSSGNTVVVNNRTTAVPFADPALQSTSFSPGVTGSQQNLQGTLAGKVLGLQSTAAGVFAFSATNVVLGTANKAQLPDMRVQLQTGTDTPGMALAAGERIVITCAPQYGWLQWLSISGSATLLVWELV